MAMAEDDAIAYSYLVHFGLGGHRFPNRKTSPLMVAETLTLTAYSCPLPSAMFIHAMVGGVVLFGIFLFLDDR